MSFINANKREEFNFVPYHMDHPSCLMLIVAKENSYFLKYHWEMVSIKSSVPHHLDEVKITEDNKFWFLRRCVLEKTNFNLLYTNKNDIYLDTMKIISGTLKSTLLSWLHFFYNMGSPDLRWQHSPRIIKHAIDF